MNKNYYDMLTQARDLLEGAAGGVDLFREVATDFVEDTALAVNGAVEKAIVRIDSFLNASPLEDPVVPSSGAKTAGDASSFWSDVTDKARAAGTEANANEPGSLPNPEDTTEEFMRETLVKRLKYSEEKVAKMGKSEVEASYLGVIFGDLIVKKLKGKGGPLGF